MNTILSSTHGQDKSDHRDLHDKYEENLVTVGRLRHEVHVAMVAADQATREAAVDALQRAMDDRHSMERRLADRFIREMRLAVRLSPSDVRHHLEDLVSDDIERRLAVVECAVAEAAVALEELGVTA